MDQEKRSLGFAWKAFCDQPYGQITAPMQTAALRKLRSLGAALEHDDEIYYATRKPQALDLAQLRRTLPQFDVRLALELDSTQDEVRRLLAAQQPTPILVLSETQSMGRGRAGKQWLSPFGRNLYFTLGFRLPRKLAALSALSLVVGGGVLRALRSMGAAAQIKWPNDIWVAGRKLAGILVEASSDGEGAQVLIGVGFNIDLGHDVLLPSEQAHSPALEQAWIDWHSVRFGRVDRTALLGRLVQSIDRAIEQFMELGLATVIRDLAKADALSGYPMTLDDGRQGRGLGINLQGALRVATDDAELVVTSGSVSSPEARRKPWRLFLDAGNTRLKWAWQAIESSTIEADGVRSMPSCLIGPACPWPSPQGGNEPGGSIPLLRAAMRQMHLDSDPESIVLASSLHPMREQALVYALKDALGAPILKLVSPGQCGIWRSSYSAPERLGVDRFLAMQAALALAEPGETVLLALVGSALTIDLLHASGEHRGGLIAPGARLAMDALGNLSTRLVVDGVRQTQSSGLAQSTQAAISAAAWQSQAALIDRMARLHHAERIVLSGGGAGRVAALLEHPCEVWPNMVLYGMALALPQMVLVD